MNSPEKRHIHASKGLLALILFLFLVSGFSALLYQVAWQRILAIFTGVDVHSVTIIIASFMGGLGFGSMAGGYISDKLAKHWLMLLFAAAEFVICVFAIFSKYFYYDWLYLKHPLLALSPTKLTITLFFSLLVPTFFMGLTLPLLSRALTTSVEGAASVIGALYGINTLGSAIGAFVTGWILFRLLGFDQSLYVGAAMNFFCAVGALYAARLIKTSSGFSQPEASMEEID